MSSYDAYLNRSFPIGVDGHEGLDVVSSYEIAEQPDLQGWKCPVCGRVHLAHGEGSVRVTPARCCDGELQVLAIEQPDPKSWEDLEREADEWRETTAP